MLGSRFTKRDKRHMLKCAKNLWSIYNNILKKEVIFKYIKFKKI